MAVTASRYRVTKTKKKPKNPKSMVELFHGLTDCPEPEPPCYAESTLISIDWPWKAWTKFCEKVYEETSYFSTPDPIEVCKYHLRSDITKRFLTYSCDVLSITSASSLFTFAKAWRMGVHLYSRYPVPLPIKTDMKNFIIGTLIDEYELEEMAKFKKNMNSDDIFDLAYHFWVVCDEWYPEERQRVNHWILDVFCASTTARGGSVVESSGYFGHNDAVQYRDIYLFAIRDPDNGPRGVKLAAHVQLRLLKGKRNRGNPPVLKFVERRDTPSFCLIKFILGLAFKDMPFLSKWIKDPKDLYNIRIPSRLNSVPIEWDPEWLHIPLIRRSTRDRNGQICTSPTRAQTLNQMATWNKRLGRSFGMEDVFELKMLRRTAAAALTRTAPDAVRNKAMGHANSSIWENFYQNDILEADIVAAILEKPSDETAMRLLGHVSLTRDPNAPYKLTESQRQQVTKDPDIQIVKAQLVKFGASLRSQYRTISAARRKARQDDGLQRTLNSYDTSRKELKKLQARKETEMLENLRENYFATLGSVCLHNQHTGQDEPLGPTAPKYRFKEREGLAKLLFPSPTTHPVPYQQQVENSCEIIRLVSSLCGLRENPRSRREQKYIESGLEGDLDIEPCFIDTCPDVFPIQCPGTQCLFCLGADDLPIKDRTRCFKNVYTLTRHVHTQHLNKLPPGIPFECCHPYCVTTKFMCENVNHFKSHALTVHNIIHGV